ncbi:MAG: purine-nucleoside phosphorylase [Taibaiella sp.]|nr:purine-nucleoside phosphorylase [Taibaiella sp.]
MDHAQQVQEATTYLKNAGFDAPIAGIVLGTGLGKMVEQVNIEYSIPYTEIPHFPEATVEFHAGKLIYGSIGKIKVIAMQGRFHYYEGYTMQQITFPVRVMHALGVKHLFLSNAAGGINADYKKGDLVLIDDHINLQTGNPLTGLNKPEYGPRFPDMSRPYDHRLNQLLLNAAKENGIQLKQGVYTSVQGPNLETRAEYRFLGIIGSDMVGMSTVPEVIVANQIGLPCAAVSVITDECDPDNLQPVDISEIIAVAGMADGKLSKVFASAIGMIAL